MECRNGAGIGRSDAGIKSGKGMTMPWRYRQRHWQD